MCNRTSPRVTVSHPHVEFQKCTRLIHYKTASQSRVAHREKVIISGTGGQNLEIC